MRISHTDLEACVRNPRQWYASTTSASDHGYKMGYERVLRLSVVHFHKSSAREARAYLKALVKRHNLKNAAKVVGIEDGLESYIEWTVAERLKVAGTEVRIAHELGFLELRGQIGRVDVTDSGCRAVLFGDAPLNWQAQLRLPLIQTAIASTYGRPPERTAVGFQRLDGGGLQEVVFAPHQIAAAENRFRALGRIVRRLSTRRIP